MNIVVVHPAHELEDDIYIHSIHGRASSQVPYITEIELHPLSPRRALFHVDIIHWEGKGVIDVTSKKGRNWSVGYGDSSGMVSHDETLCNFSGRTSVQNIGFQIMVVLP